MGRLRLIATDIRSGMSALPPPGFRASPRAVFAVTSIRLQSLTPSRLWCCAPRLRGKQRPAAMGGAWGLRPGLLRQVARKRAALDAGGLSPVPHEGRFTDTQPGLAMELPRHASNTRPPVAAGALSPCRLVLSLPVSGRRPVKPSRGDAESATSPFGSGRPVRNCVVVNPGGGWASWPQPSSENNFPCAARFPRAANSFRFQVLHGVATAARCGQPIPRRPDHNKDALARPCSTRKEKHHG